MLRRPLIRPSGKFSLLARGNAACGLPPYEIHAPESMHVYPTLADVAGAVGLDEVPDKAVMRSPCLPGQHPTTFLQIGWASDAKRQTAVELGDAGMIVSLHFRRNDPALKACPWHLDVVEIDDGRIIQGTPVPIHLPCDEEPYRAHIMTLFGMVGGVVAALSRADAPEADRLFKTALHPLVREMDDISATMADEHAAAEWPCLNL